MSFLQKSSSMNNNVIRFVEARNPLNTKRRHFYLNTQFVPRSKHFSPRL